MILSQLKWTGEISFHTKSSTVNKKRIKDIFKEECINQCLEPPPKLCNLNVSLGKSFITKVIPNLCSNTDAEQMNIEQLYADVTHLNLPSFHR